MKRVIPILLAMAMAISLTACAKSKEAQAVDDMILALGTIDTSSAEAIEEAEAAYDALSDSDKKSVDNYAALTEARSTFNQLKANEVMVLINSIGVVTERSQSEIHSAIDAYDQLSEDQKELVTNYSNLLAAEESFLAIKVQPIESLIEEISQLDLTGENMPEGAADKIAEANTMYDELEQEFKDKVGNYDKLVSATKILSDRRVAYITSLIDEHLREVDRSSEVYLNAVQKAYEQLTEEEKERITNYDVVEEAKKELEELQNQPPLRINSYTLSKDIIGNPNISISATNLTNEIIKEFSFTIFAYDGEGIPVKTYFNSFSSKLRYDNALKGGENSKSNIYWQLYGDFNAIKQVVAVLDEVVFYNGSTWENPQRGTLYSKYNEKLLPAGDENVLPNG